MMTQEPTMSDDDNAMEYGLAYNAKDLILYALSIGMGSSEDDADELRFLYERHPQFSSVPTFCLALTFWSDRGDANTARIPPFPPPLMAKEEVIPKRFLRGTANISKFPVIHTWSSIVWDKPLPIPIPGPPASRVGDNNIHTRMNLKTISVLPKSIGTFVTSQSQVVTVDPRSSANPNHEQSRICTMQSTGLVLGITPTDVVSYDSGIARLTCKPSIPEDRPPLLEWTYRTASSQALLYRLASGDSNRIHVDTSASELLGSEKKAPLLHGLFTLAVAFRGILKKVVDDGDSELADKTIIRKLEGKFTQPAFVGDQLCVKIWKDEFSPRRFLFVVVNQETGATLLDCGSAELDDEAYSTVVSRSKL
jgi:acyl dehydratase